MKFSLAVFILACTSVAIPVQFALLVGLLAGPASAAGISAATGLSLLQLSTASTAVSTAIVPWVRPQLASLVISIKWEKRE
jgi:hypothetical protein